MSDDGGTFVDGTDVLNPWKYALTPAQVMFAEWCVFHGTTPTSANVTEYTESTYWTSFAKTVLHGCDSMYVEFKPSPRGATVIGKRFCNFENVSNSGDGMWFDYVCTSKHDEFTLPKSFKDIPNSGLNDIYKEWMASISPERFSQFAEHYSENNVSNAQAVFGMPGNNFVVLPRMFANMYALKDDDKSYRLQYPWVHAMDNVAVNIILRINDEGKLEMAVGSTKVTLASAEDVDTSFRATLDSAKTAALKILNKSTTDAANGIVDPDESIAFEISRNETQVEDTSATLSPIVVLASSESGVTQLIVDAIPEGSTNQLFKFSDIQTLRFDGANYNPEAALAFGAFYVLSNAAARASLQNLTDIDTGHIAAAHIYWSKAPIQRGWHMPQQIYNALIENGNVKQASPGPPPSGFRTSDIKGFKGGGVALVLGSTYPMMVWSPQLGRPVLAAKTATGVPFYDALSIVGNTGSIVQDASDLLSTMAETVTNKETFLSHLNAEMAELPPPNPVFENNVLAAVRAGSRVEPLMVPEFALRPHCIAHNAALEEVFTFKEIDALNRAIRARFELYPTYMPVKGGGADVSASSPPPVGSVLSPIPSVSLSPLAVGDAPVASPLPFAPLSTSSPAGGASFNDDDDPGNATTPTANSSTISRLDALPFFPIDDLVRVEATSLAISIKTAPDGDQPNIMGAVENTADSIGDRVFDGLKSEESTAFLKLLTKYNAGEFVWHQGTAGNQPPNLGVACSDYLGIAYETGRLNSAANLKYWKSTEKFGCFLFDGRIGIGIPLLDGRIFGPDGHFYKNHDSWTNGDLPDYNKDEFNYLKDKNDALLATRLYKMYARKLQSINGKMVPCTAQFTKLPRGFTPSDDPLTVKLVNIAFDTNRVYWMEPGKPDTFKSWSHRLTRNYIPWLVNIKVGTSNEDTTPFKDTGRRREKEPSDVFPANIISPPATSGSSST